ncbi:uncharacterized protein LOC143161987 isoform X3 [Aptenodytes patagonicus]|uniref:uncharacterized protein LOC143161987 isoform X3 n=1 Tax=Aptenodytes patagonicus TaxID=9234 RepID=UPI003FA18BEA
MKGREYAPSWSPAVIAHHHLFWHPRIFPAHANCTASWLEITWLSGHQCSRQGPAMPFLQSFSSFHCMLLTLEESKSNPCSTGMPRICLWGQPKLQQSVEKAGFSGFTFLQVRKQNKRDLIPMPVSPHYKVTARHNDTLCLLREDGTEGLSALLGRTNWKEQTRTSNLKFVLTYVYL